MNFCVHDLTGKFWSHGRACHLSLNNTTYVVRFGCWFEYPTFISRSLKQRERRRMMNLCVHDLAGQFWSHGAHVGESDEGDELPTLIGLKFKHI